MRHCAHTWRNMMKYPSDEGLKLTRRKRRSRGLTGVACDQEKWSVVPVQPEANVGYYSESEQRFKSITRY